MEETRLTLDELIREYHHACQALFNVYNQIRVHNEHDPRLSRLMIAFNKNSALMNLCADLKRRQNETRKSDL